MDSIQTDLNNGICENSKVTDTPAYESGVNNRTIDISSVEVDNNVVNECKFKKPRLSSTTTNLESSFPLSSDHLASTKTTLDTEIVKRKRNPISITNTNPAKTVSLITTSETGIHESEVEDMADSDLLDDDDDEEEDEEEEEEDDDEDDATLIEDEDTESDISESISAALQQEWETRKIEDRKLLCLLAHFDEDQLNRFETFRRATFAKVSVRRLIQSVACCSVSQKVAIAMAGLTKVFIGELVEEALIYKERVGDSGPLQPKHIREAYRLLSEKDKCCTEKPINPLF